MVPDYDHIESEEMCESEGMVDSAADVQRPESGLPRTRSRDELSTDNAGGDEAEQTEDRSPKSAWQREQREREVNAAYSLAALARQSAEPSTVAARDAAVVGGVSVTHGVPEEGRPTTILSSRGLQTGVPRRGDGKNGVVRLRGRPTTKRPAKARAPQENEDPQALPVPGRIQFKPTSVVSLRDRQPTLTVFSMRL